MKLHHLAFCLTVILGLALVFFSTIRALETTNINVNPELRNLQSQPVAFLPLIVKPHEPGQGLLFRTNRDGNWEIYNMYLDGSHLVNLSNHPDGDYNSAWSPDGTKIAFESFRAGGALQVYTMNSNGSNPLWLTQGSNTVAMSPDWSPNGQFIAYHTHEFFGERIAIMNADGTDRHPLTNNPTSELLPDWSPNGDYVAFENHLGFNHSEIFIFHVDGTEQIQLTNNSELNSAPAWSPDGSKIAFASNFSGNWEIYIMNADGSGQINLTNNSADDQFPVWSPDSSQIAFSSNRDNNVEIYLMNADGSGQINLTNHPSDDYVGDWR